MESRLRTAATTAQETREGVVAPVPTRKRAQRHAVTAASASRTGVESRRWIDLSLRRWVFPNALGTTRSTLAYGLPGFFLPCCCCPPAGRGRLPPPPICGCFPPPI